MIIAKMLSQCLTLRNNINKETVCFKIRFGNIILEFSSFL